ncbi:MAG: hypothetical protein Q8P41_21950 [Pseudomonadota bacterium]|nr:hypothetical protein [Pseudomonadota bacterium]
MRRLVPLLLLGLAPGAVRADGAIERRLHADSADASSFLWTDWNKFQENYHPLYAVDDDPATAWVEGAAGGGAGEWVRFNVTRLDGASAVRLRIRNGYQKSSALWKANARVREVTVTLLPSGTRVKATLTDTEGWQELRVEQPAGPLEAIQLTADSVYAGTRYTDLCISDVELYVTSATRDNPVVEKAKLERVLAWKGDRVAAARMFKDAAAGQIPIAPGYTLAASAGRESPVPARGPFGGALVALADLRTHPTEPGLRAPEAEMALAVAGFESGFAGWTPVQAVANDTRPVPAVDGLAPAALWNCYEGPPVWGDATDGSASGTVELPIAGTLGFLRADGVGTFAVSQAPTVAAAIEADLGVCAKPTPHILAWAKTAPATASSPARLEALLTVGCGTLEVREGRERVSVPQLLVYDTTGKLSLLVGGTYATAFGWRGEGAGAVLSDARRVSAGSATIRMTERKAP